MGFPWQSTKLERSKVRGGRVRQVGLVDLNEDLRFFSKYDKMGSSSRAKSQE